MAKEHQEGSAGAGAALAAQQTNVPAILVSPAEKGAELVGWVLLSAPGVSDLALQVSEAISRRGWLVHHHRGIPALTER